MSEQKIQEIKDKLEMYQYWKGHRTAILLFVIFSLGLGAGMVFGGASSPDRPVKPKELGDSTDRDLVETGTKYQEEFVDCPKRYMSLCTEMSRLHSEQVSFKSANASGNNLLRLDMARDRVMIAKIQDGGDEGYFMRIEN